MALWGSCVHWYGDLFGESPGGRSDASSDAVIEMPLLKCVQGGKPLTLISRPQQSCTLAGQVYVTTRSKVHATSCTLPFANGLQYRLDHLSIGSITQNTIVVGRVRPQSRDAWHIRGDGARRLSSTTARGRGEDGHAPGGLQQPACFSWCCPASLFWRSGQTAC